MKATVVVDKNDVGLLAAVCSTDDRRGSDELPEHISEILQILVPQVSPTGYGQCYFDGTETELEALLENALEKPVQFECRNGGEWEVRPVENTRILCS